MTARKSKAQENGQTIEKETAIREGGQVHERDTAAQEGGQDTEKETAVQEGGQDTEKENAATESEQNDGKEAEPDMFGKLPNPCVYCGPSVRGVARQYTTFMGGIPDPLKEFIKAHPTARALLVGTAQFAGIRKRLETPGTAEAVMYKKVKSEL